MIAEVFLASALALPSALQMGRPLSKTQISHILDKTIKETRRAEKFARLPKETKHDESVREFHETKARRMEFIRASSQRPSLIETKEQRDNRLRRRLVELVRDLRGLFPHIHFFHSRRDAPVAAAGYEKETVPWGPWDIYWKDRRGSA